VLLEKLTRQTECAGRKSNDFNVSSLMMQQPAGGEQLPTPTSNHPLASSSVMSEPRTVLNRPAVVEGSALVAMHPRAARRASRGQVGISVISANLGARPAAVGLRPVVLQRQGCAKVSLVERIVFRADDTTRRIDPAPRLDQDFHLAPPRVGGALLGVWEIASA
jgi:hypothetical protein